MDTSILPFVVKECTGSTSVDGVILGNADAIAKLDKNAPFEFSIEEKSTNSNGQAKQFVIKSNKPVDIQNTSSSESVKINMHGHTVIFTIHPGGSLTGFYGDCCVEAKNAGMDFGGFSIGVMKGKVNTTVNGSKPMKTIHR